MNQARFDLLSRWKWLESEVVTKRVTSPSRKLTLIYLVMKWSRRDSGQAWPSAATIAEHTGLSLRTVYSCLKELEVKRLIIRAPRTDHNKNSTLWTINFDLQSPADIQKEIDDLEAKMKLETDPLASMNLTEKLVHLEEKMDSAGMQ